MNNNGREAGELRCLVMPIEEGRLVTSTWIKGNRGGGLGEERWNNCELLGCVLAGKEERSKLDLLIST